MGQLRSTRILIVAALLAAAACTVHQTEAPSLTGPSTFALSVSVTATPDAINRDGVSQSSITVTVRGPNGQPVANQAVRLDMAVGGSLQDFGTLSARSLVTGSDGTTHAIYTAPPAPPTGVSPATSTVSIVATPSGTNAQTAVSQSVDIRLTPIGVILPTGPAPAPKFTFSPAAPLAAQPVAFDASASCPGPLNAAAMCVASGTIVSYQWNFGDGSTGSGVSTSHTFSMQQSFTVTLTVTNDLGVSASTTQAVVVGAGVVPTGNFTFSPSPVSVNDTVYFDASGIHPGPGRTITQFSWDFGDGAESTGFQTTHKFTSPSIFTVTLSVRDDLGQGATFTNTVTVGTGKPTAVLILTKQGGNIVKADGSASTPVGSATISTYSFDFGGAGTGTGFSGSTESSSSPTATYNYTSAGTYTITLTVTDSLTPGRVSVPTTQTITVP